MYMVEDPHTVGGEWRRKRRRRKKEKKKKRSYFNFMSSLSVFRSNCQKLPTLYVVLVTLWVCITEFSRKKRIWINRIIFGISWKTTFWGIFLILGCFDIHMWGKLQTTYFGFMFLLCEIKQIILAHEIVSWSIRKGKNFYNLTCWY